MRRQKTVGTLECRDCKAKRRIAPAERKTFISGGLAALACARCGNTRGNSLSDDHLTRTLGALLRF
jgi:hypothetical protein